MMPICIRRPPKASEFTLRSQPVFACDDFEAMRQAAQEGLGIGYLPDWVVGPDVKAGQLIQLFPEWSGQPCATTGIHALRELRKPPARVTALLDQLRTYIGSRESWSLGHAGG
jgi:DNA-binding transcriptional LysR family regulator